MKSLLIVTCSIVVVLINHQVNCLPVKPTPAPSKAEPVEEHQQETNLEYERYLKEIVNALETDPEFRAKLDKADEADIRSGKIAQELEYVSHHIRTKLDEIKRQELQRLRHLATREYELENEIDRQHLKIAEHLDHDNQHTFEIEDLRKLILKTSSDLAEADRKRRNEFKEYEMQKEFEKQEKLRQLDEEHRKKYEEELKKQHDQHNKHEKLHHPGNKAQLEEVWEKQDHMEGENFDPKVFFMIHDVDGNGFWDEMEVKALFVKELDKVYQEGLPEDDMRERVEEMERMREHVFKEADTNHDGLISYQEFIEQTKREEFNRDPGWDTVDNQPQYTHEEYANFERQRQEEIQRMIAAGQLPPHQNMPGGGYYPNQQNGYQAHPNEIPQHGQQPQQQYHYQQPNQQQDYHQQQMHQQQQQYHAQQQQQQQYNGQQQQQQQYHDSQHQQHQQQQPQHQQQQHGQPVNLQPNQVYHQGQDAPKANQPHQNVQQNLPPSQPPPAPINNQAQPAPAHAAVVANPSPSQVGAVPPPVPANQQQHPPPPASQKAAAHPAPPNSVGGGNADVKH